MNVIVIILGAVTVATIVTLMGKIGGWTAHQCDTFGCGQYGDKAGTRPDGSTVWKCADHDPALLDAEWERLTAAVGPRDADEALAQWSADYQHRDQN